MALQDLLDALPPYAADLRANLLALEDARDLSVQERWGCLLACAVAAGDRDTLRHVAEGAAEPLGERGMKAAKAAAAVTSMNDIYYGALGGLRNGEYATLPAGLHMDALAHPGVERDAFELWCLSVSALDRCAPCMDAQEEELRRRGAPPARMQAAMRVAAVIGAVARVLTAEAALAENSDDDAEGDAGGAERAGETADAPSAPAPRPAGTADPATAAGPHPAPGGLTITPG